jgi:hypothetical protein
MLPERLKNEIENSSILLPTIQEQKNGLDWSTFTRTTFMKIAKHINKKVSLDVIESPYLIEDNLLMGSIQLDRIFNLHSLKTITDFLDYVRHIPKYRTYNWISGKTLQSYWNNENAKDKKLNVLLTFLGVHHNQWDQWKLPTTTSLNLPSTNNSIYGNDEQTNHLLKKYFLGHYFRYYQKLDSSRSIIKTPLILREFSNGQVYDESK